MTTKKLSRREFLKLSGVAAAGAVLASCGKPTPEPTVAPTQAPDTVTTVEPTQAPPPKVVEGNVVVMHFLHEFTEDMAKAFMADNPNITVELVAADQTRLFAMLAAGTPPDLYRCQAPFIPQSLARKLLYDLTPYFEASDTLKLDDLMPANNYYKAKSPLEVGEGPIYGMCKDFSPDFTIFANKGLFEAAGVGTPDPSKVLTFDEVHQIAAATTKFEGDRIVNYGWGYENGWVDRMWMNMLAEKDAKLYTDQYDTILIDSDDAKAAVQWFFDMAKEKVTHSPINPSPNGWFGTDYNANILAMAEYGFWFSAMAETDQNRGNCVMLPAPTWTGVRRDPTMTATGMIMISKTQVPDAAWKVFEYYNAGQPALDRAGSGWGVPALKSMVNLIPQSTDFQKQAYACLQGELDLNTTPLQFNPFIGESTVVDSWNKFLDQALKDQITFDDMIAGIKSEVNFAIKEGIDRIAG
jgi:multiple sugar transport system substrate-binding protein